jgi:transcriptional regulator with XRE-family HTH domain
MIDRVHQKIGARFRVLRLQRGESLRRIAGAAGVGLGRLHDVEEKIYGPDGWSLGLICRIAAVFGCEVSVSIRPRSR